MELWKELELDKAEFPQVIAIVGSGGKTSFMGRLAREGKEHNLRVAVLTTTHIWKPSGYQEVFFAAEKGSITIYGTDCGNGKITYPGDTCYQEICKQADLILVEADGSRGLPVKYPAEYEPVIPDNADKIICVCGMSGLGHPGSEVCHRWELVKEQGFLVKQGEELETDEGKGFIRSHRMASAVRIEADVITSQVLTEILERGYGKPLTQAYPKAAFYYCLNQADTAELQKEAADILRRTGRKGLILSLPDRKNILYDESEPTDSLLKKIRSNSKIELKIAMIYMASGFGKRYGANKLLERVEGKPLFLHGLQVLKEVKDRTESLEKSKITKEGEHIEEETTLTGSQATVNIEFVVVSQYEEILHTAEDLGARAVYNPDSHTGITASIHRGIQAVPDADAYLFAVADQPWLKPESVLRLMQGFCTGEKSIACLTDGTRNGNPVIFSRKYKEELLNLAGDRGGSVILKRYPEEVRKVFAEEKELRDVDIPINSTTKP